MAKIVLENVYFSVKKTDIINGVSLSIGPGESLVLFGQSGSGKSTLFKLCIGLDIPTAGRILINGIDINKVIRKKKLELMKNIGFVFQDGGLITNLSVFDNVAVSLRYHKMLPEKEIVDKVTALLVDLGLWLIHSHLPGSLSPGQKKLTVFAREILINPDILFFDDPTTSIDSFTIRKFINVINDHVQKGGVAVTITHNQEFADAIATKIAVLDAGRLIACGDPETIRASEDEAVKQVLKGLSVEKELADEFLKLMIDDILK